MILDTLVFKKIVPNDEMIKNNYIKMGYKLTEKTSDNGTKYYEAVKYKPISYDHLVAKLISEKYDMAKAIELKKNTNSEEYKDYIAYVKECEASTKKFVEERERFLNVNSEESEG